MAFFSMPSQIDRPFGIFVEPTSSRKTQKCHSRKPFVLSHLQAHFSLRHPGLFVLVQVKLGNPGSDAAAAGWATCGAVVFTFFCPKSVPYFFLKENPRKPGLEP